ncbi:hypothetical protein XENOCAPTIV_003287 [Xenoophorus captivus]|uniref:Uncharacterized protein n=1 Tax=Xenoophorus captivus TaxID=1517983 RepID=A0ABV0RNE9_9TELE
MLRRPTHPSANRSLAPGARATEGSIGGRPPQHAKEPLAGARRLPNRRTGHRSQGPRSKAIQTIPRGPKSQRQHQRIPKTRTSTPAQIPTRRPAPSPGLRPQAYLRTLKCGVVHLKGKMGGEEGLGAPMQRCTHVRRRPIASRSKNLPDPHAPA